MSKKILDKKQIEDFFNDPYNEEVIELISNTIASYIVSAITANLSPDLIKKALTDIIKTLSPEQPSETKEQNIDIKEKTKDWSKHSDATLRRERNRRKQKGLPIEDSLNEELAKRFPNYNKEARCFERIRNTDWSKSSDSGLRTVYKNRKTKGLPIEDSLNEELAKRFDWYDKETRTFKETDWSKSSEDSLRTVYRNRKQKGLPIEDSLNEELAKRFDWYDKETQSFKEIDWSKSSEDSIRHAYHNRIKKGLTIEDSLNEELAKRFPGYNPKTKTFKRNKKAIDLSKSSDNRIRNIYYSRKKKNKPIEDSLNEELSKRFPNYNAENRTFEKNAKRRKNTNWSASSKDSLRNTYYSRKKAGKPIEDSLNEELAKRFPNYNKGTRCFGKNIKRITNTDWSKSSENSIKTTYYARKKKGKPIEDSLNEELAKRFPNYNPEKKSFGNGHKNISSSNTRITNQKESTPNTNIKQTHTNIAITIPLFSAINKNGKYDLYTYDKENKPIKLIKNSIAEYDLYFYDDAFNKAVVRKKNDINSFSLYIIDTQKGSLLRLFNQGIDILRYIPQNHKILLSGKNSFYYTAIAPNSKIEKIINVPLNVEILKAQSTPKHTVLINKNCEEIKVPLLKITDESELEKRNNIINHLLGKLSNTPPVKELKSENQNVKEEKQEIKQNTDWSKSSENSIKTAYYTRKKKGKPIEDSLNEELAKRFDNYDKGKKVFTPGQNWSKSSEDSIRHAYHNRIKKGLPIEDSLNEELAKRFDNYDKERKAFTPRQKSKKDWCKYSDMGLRNIYYSRKRESLPIEDSLNEELAKRFKKYDSETRTFVKQKDLAQKAKENIDNHDSKNATVIIPSAHTVEALPKTEKEPYQKIIVEIKPIKMTLEGAYNDVFINGRKILKNHINTEVQLFCEDTILGIHGIISGNKYYPESPIWLIYDTNIQQRPPEQKNIITKHNILVKKIYNYPEEIRLELDNRAIVILKNEKMKKIAELRRFVLDKQK